MNNDLELKSEFKGEGLVSFVDDETLTIQIYDNESDIIKSVWINKKQTKELIEFLSENLNNIE